MMEDNADNRDNAPEGAQNAEGALMKVANMALDVALNGFGPFKSARALAESYTGCRKYKDDDERIRALIHSQCWTSGGSGFVTGLGGGAALVIGGLAVDMASVLEINLRMVGAIALIRGYDLEDEFVRLSLLLTAIGTGIEEALADVGVHVGMSGCKALICKIPRKLLGRINKYFGRKLVTKFGQKGVVQLGKAVPVVGGLVGGAVNAAGCHAIGKLACKAFPVVVAA